MFNKIELGNHGECIAADHLTGKGYKIKERNFRCHTGEIDIIAEHEGYLIFVEVKYRKSLKYGYPREAVTKSKQRTITRNAMYYMMKNNIINKDVRFDVIEILDNGQLTIEHIEDAF